MALSMQFLQDIGCHSTYICLSSLSLLFVINLIFIPFCIYASIKYHRICYIQAMTRRYPQTVIFLSILNILHLFIVSNYLLIFNGLMLDFAYSNYWILWFGPFIYEPWFLLIIIINVYRLWLIHFDIKFNVGKTRQKWQSLLNEGVVFNLTFLCIHNIYIKTDGGDDWYSQNKNKWGDQRWLYKIVASVWMILSIFMIIPLMLQSDIIDEYKIEEIVYAFIVVLVAFAALFIWCNVPHFDDEFFIFKEMKLFIICAIILCVSWFILLFWTKRGNAVHIAQIGILSLFNFMQIFVSEFVVLHRIKHTKRKHKMHRQISFEKNLKMKERDLFSILLNSDIGIEEYVKHLQKEFCLENILFLIEILQWLYHETNKEWDKYDIHPMYADNIEYKMCKIIPISSINSNDSTDWYTKIKQIHQKYIDSSANLEVNLPYRIRIEFDNLFRLYQMKMDINAGVYKPKMIKISKTLSLSSKKTSNIWSITKMLTRRKSKIPKIPQNINQNSINAVADIDKLTMSKSVNLKRGTLIAPKLSTLNELQSAPMPEIPSKLIMTTKTNKTYNITNTRTPTIDGANTTPTRTQTASLLKTDTPSILAALCNKGHLEEIKLPPTDKIEDEEAKHDHGNVLNDFLDEVVPSVNEEIDRIASLSKKEAMDIVTTDLRINTSDEKIETKTSLSSSNLTPKSAGYWKLTVNALVLIMNWQVNTLCQTVSFHVDYEFGKTTLFLKQCRFAIMKMIFCVC